MQQKRELERDLRESEGGGREGEFSWCVGSPHAVSKELEPVLATRYRGCSKFGRMSKTPVCGTF